MRSFLPCGLANLYDPWLAMTMRERAFKLPLVEQADAGPGQRVLDVGCGTGTLGIWLKQHAPEASVIGIDLHRNMLALAKEKTRKAGLDIAYNQGSSTDLPYEEASFDRVLASLLLHHLSPRDKDASLREALRVLKPGGELHLADWGRSANPFMRALFWCVRLFEGFENTRANAAGALPAMLAEGGFEGVVTTHRVETVFGTVVLHKAKKPRLSERGE